MGAGMKYPWGKTVYIDPTLEILKKVTDREIYLFLGTQPAPPPNQVELYKYVKLEGVKSWNDEVRAECHKIGEQCPFVLDYLPVSVNSTSWDGLHYLQDTNLILAQILLNAVGSMDEYASRTKHRAT